MVDVPVEVFILDELDPRIIEPGPQAAPMEELGIFPIGPWI